MLTSEHYLTLLKQGMLQCIPIPQGQYNTITDLPAHICPLASTIILYKNHLLYLKFLEWIIFFTFGSLFM